MAATGLFTTVGGAIGVGAFMRGVFGYVLVSGVVALSENVTVLLAKLGLGIEVVCDR